MPGTDWEWGLATSSTPEACIRSARSGSDIIRAEGALRWAVFREWRGLLALRALEFLPEVLIVFRADLQLQHFFDHWRKVGQRADRTQRRRACRTYHSPRRCQDECVLDSVQRHAAFVQSGRKRAVRTTH